MLTSPHVRRRVAAAACLLLVPAVACSDGATPPAAAPDAPAVLVTAPAAAVATTPGQTGTARVTITRRGGFAGAVTLAVADLPPGIAATLAPTTLEGDATESAVTTTVAPGVAPGTYTFAVVGTAAGVAAVRTTVAVAVAAGASPAISLGTPATAGVSVTRGASATAAVTVARTNGYAGEVALAAEGLPAGVTAAFAPATVPAGEGAATLTIAAGPEAAGGPATVTVRAKGAGVADALVTVPLTVTIPAAAIAVAAPPAVRIAQGGSATAEIAFTRANFAGEVTVSLDDAPSGVSAVGATAPAGASTVALALRVAPGAATGGHPLTVRLAGPGGQPTATATLPLTVTAAGAPAAVLDGVYLGIRQNAATGGIYHDYWTFLPDGRMVRTHPSEGLNRPADYEAICRLVECATYTLHGTEMRMRRQGGAETVYDFDAAGSFAERGELARYRPVAPLDGFRVAATYAVVEPARARTLVSITLTRDGRFTEEKLMEYTRWVQLAPPGETRVALPGGSGTYTVTRNTLALRYDGGQTAYFFFVVPPGEIGNAVPNVVYVNTTPISRVP